nr:FtsX-like permease family protein [Bdellovibrionales bacterium]
TRLVKELFADRSPVGEMIKINRISFQVIGVLPEKGFAGPQDQDDRIIIPVATSMRRLFGKYYVDLIEIEAESSDKVAIAQTAGMDLMNMRFHVPENKRDDAFDVRNMADIQAAMSATTSTMTLLLSMIAAISLLVGGIGIMNIMLVSVTERTREIGLRKAVGATRGDIQTQFLIEAIVISAVGGLLGLVLAWVATILLSLIAGWATSISVSSAILAFFFSGGIGVIFGLYPARKASRLAPIDALRYE